MILWPELSAAPDNIKVVTDNDTTEEQEEPVEYAAEHEQWQSEQAVSVLTDDETRILTSPVSPVLHNSRAVSHTGRGEHD